MSADAAMRIAARMMAKRLRVWQELQAKQVRDKITHITLHQGELFEAEDMAALEAYEAAEIEINGARPLPLEYSA